MAQVKAVGNDRGAADAPIRVGVSACLLGEKVRYDGGHKRDRFVTDLLGRFVEWVPVCPELEAGMGVPRPPIRLQRDGETLRLVETASGQDHTRRMGRYAERRVRAIAPSIDRTASPDLLSKSTSPEGEVNFRRRSTST